MQYSDRIQVNVHLEHIRANIRNMMKRLAPGTKACMVVKADGYGCGAVKVAQAVYDLVDFYAVSASVEAAELRSAGIDKPILILGYTFPDDLEEMIRLDVRINIFREEDAILLSEKAAKLGLTAKVHYSLNTGMNRIGFEPTEETLKSMKRIAALPNLAIEGLFTHFAKADAADLTDAEKQFACYKDFKAKMDALGLTPSICHAANSAATLVMTDASFNMVRLGIAAYGYYPSGEIEKTVPLYPAVEMKSHVTYVKTVPAGAGIGYGYAYVAPEPRVIATVPVGYADGYSRLLSNKGEVLIRGKRAVIRGRVCMDQMMVDVTDIPGVTEGDEATLLGRDGAEEITLEELEARSGVLTYEILCGFSHRRVMKHYIQ